MQASLSNQCILCTLPFWTSLPTNPILRLARGIPVWTQRKAYGGAGATSCSRWQHVTSVVVQGVQYANAVIHPPVLSERSSHCPATARSFNHRSTHILTDQYRLLARPVPSSVQIRPAIAQSHLELLTFCKSACNLVKGQTCRPAWLLPQQSCGIAGSPATLIARFSTAAAASPATKRPAQPTNALRPFPPYEALVEHETALRSGKTTQQPVLDKYRRGVITAVLAECKASGTVKNHSLQLGINDQLFQRAWPAFGKFLMRAITAELRDCIIELRKQGKDTRADQEQLLLSFFASYAHQHYGAEIADYFRQVTMTDLRQPHTWYPFARALQRKIIYHAGPTNSGKTYHALLALKAAECGVYCGPLRLLAMEVYDTLNMEGVPCNMVTGQEQRVVPGARHVACTVEMAKLQSTRYDVAVIDEIQMIGDESRGSSWTRALLGLPANEIHLCGDGSALALVEGLCRDGGDEFEVRRYERFSQLEVEFDGMPKGVAGVQPGDCIVAFSRNRIYELKHAIEQRTAHWACVVYGALPPETRRTQARLFNDSNNRFNVLVASDAVGMGLNLNIRRVVFDALHKVAGRKGGKRKLTVSEIKQIAGRAGRRNSQYPEGVVTCINRSDIPLLKEALDVPLDALTIKGAGLAPEFEQLEVLAATRPNANLATILSEFASTAQVDGQYFFCNHDHTLEVAKWVDTVAGLSLADRYIFCLAPARMDNVAVRHHLLMFAWKYGKGYPVDLTVNVPSRAPMHQGGMKDLETMYQVVMLWLWLSYRFPEGSFPGRDDVMRMQAQLVALLDDGLESLRKQRQKQSKSRSGSRQVDSSSSCIGPDPGVRSILELDPRIRRFISIKDIKAINMSAMWLNA